MLVRKSRSKAARKVSTKACACRARALLAPWPETPAAEAEEEEEEEARKYFFPMRVSVSRRLCFGWVGVRGQS